VAAIFLATLAGGLLLWLGFRDLLLERKLNQMQAKAFKHGIKLSFSNPHWAGLRTVQFDAISMEENGKQIFLASTVEAVPSLSQCWNSSAGFASISLESFYFYHQQRPEAQCGKSETQVHPLFKMIASGFNWMSTCGSLTITNGVIESEKGIRVNLSVMESRLEGEIFIHQNESQNRFRVEGTFDRSCLELFINGAGEASLSHHDADIFMNEATFDLTIEPLHRGGFGISISGGADTSSVFHRALNGQPLGFGATEINLSAIADPTGFYILPTSSIFHHNIKSTFELVAPADKSKMISIGVTLPPVSAESLCEALPSNAFHVLRAVPPRGTVNGNFSIQFVPGNAESLTFTGGFYSESFSLPDEHPIHQLNTCNCYGLQRKVMGTKIPMYRSILKCASNPNWIRLQDCSQLLVQSILIAEDPDYFSHHGINASMIRQSAIDNFNNGKFKRGASTIPMQLMRNVFLHREKTICRKVEEIALVWMNEETQTVSKDRMLELYLNLAQWGPDQYGVGEAANYYFGKEVSDLNADECIFLAGLLPNPAQYKTQFTQAKKLKPFVLDFFTGVKLKLFDQDLLETDALDAPVNLRLKSGVI
jgi:Transglycosylase